MAKVTTTKTETVFVLELDEAEAQYVWAALLKVEPAHLDGDPVYYALSKALRGAGITLNDDAAVIT